MLVVCDSSLNFDIKIKGFKVQIARRLNGAKIARGEWARDS